MIHGIIHSFQDALMITIFVISMMLILEFINVLSRGRWLHNLQMTLFGQNLLGALLGALPGCLGSYSVVSMYVHRVVKIGAVVATMLVTTGDESFVMFALFPKEAALLTGMLILIGVLTGLLLDHFFLPKREAAVECKVGFSLHEEHSPFTLSPRKILEQLQSGQMIRPLLLFVIAGFIVLLSTSHTGHGFGWEQITLVTVGVFTLLLILSADEHFLMDHLWKHVILKHVTKIFGWVFITLLALEFVHHMDWNQYLSARPMALILAAALIGLIPQSGPHLMFVNLFAQGLAPFSVLLTSAIVQDGHACLPLLAHSRRDFLIVKGIKLVIGLALGMTFYLFGM
ncbi:putative manganese transporter [Myxococcota bacterium]|nr:putative manganese transporter [Myxococcota bacterium]